jgi:predicted CoA-binding protein
MRTSLDTIRNFLSHKRIAMVGISRNPQDFSAKLFEEFCRHGYDMVPVNPAALEIHARPCFACLQDVQPPIHAALMMTAPAVTETVVHDCAEAGINIVWMYRAAGKGAVSDQAIRLCREHGIQVIPGECPFMFLPETAGFHRFHGFVRKITGRYPRPTAA